MTACKSDLHSVLHTCVRASACIASLNLNAQNVGLQVLTANVCYNFESLRKNSPGVGLIFLSCWSQTYQQCLFMHTPIPSRSLYLFMSGFASMQRYQGGPDQHVAWRRGSGDGKVCKIIFCADVKVAKTVILASRWYVNRGRCGIFCRKVDQMNLALAVRRHRGRPHMVQHLCGRKSMLVQFSSGHAIICVCVQNYVSRNKDVVTDVRVCVCLRLRMNVQVCCEGSSRIKGARK